MIKKPEVLAIIPARGGSKRIPRKNIIDLCGKPLIAYSIEVALKTTLLSRVIVSTEDKEIADTARKYGAEVPFLRPIEIAGDHSDVGQAVSYTLRCLREEQYVPDMLVELYPTSIFRTAALIDQLVAYLIEGYRFVKAVKPVEMSTAYFLKLEGVERLAPVLNNPKVAFKGNGLFVGKSLHPNRAHGYYIYPIKDPIALVDIDYPEDLLLAREIIERKLFKF